MTDAAQTTSWQLTAVHHIGLTVSDIERSIHFYRDVLGMTLIRRRPNVDADYVAQQTGYDGVVLSVASFGVGGPDSGPSMEVVQYLTQSGPPSEPATNRAGTSHLCLLVDDLLASYNELRSQGVRFKSEPVTISAGPNEGGLVLYFFDPDGYTLELFQPPA